MSEIHSKYLKHMFKDAISAFPGRRGEFEVCRKEELGLNNEYHEVKIFYVKVKSGD